MVENDDDDDDDVALDDVVKSIHWQHRCAFRHGCLASASFPVTRKRCQQVEGAMKKEESNDYWSIDRAMNDDVEKMIL